MIDNSYIITKVREQQKIDGQLEEPNLAFLRFLFPLFEQVDLELLSNCNEAIPSRGVDITGYYINLDDNSINIYLSVFNQSILDGQIISESEFSAIKNRIINLIKMIDNNSYFDINEGSSLFDLCDFFVNHKQMELIANIFTNYIVPLGYEKNLTLSVGKKNLGIRTYDYKDIIDKISANNADTYSINLKDKFGKGIPAVLISQSEDVDVYLTSFPGSWIAQLYREDSVGLLSANVRSYLKKTNKVNKSIIETVKESPDSFVSYNNGLSAVATNFVATGEYYFVTINEIERFMIVNGGQTTATLYECENDNLDLENIIVPAKISLIKNIENAEEIINNISICSNSQSAIKRSDSASNTLFFKNFEAVSRQIMAKKNMFEYHCFFERTNGQYNTAKKMSNSKATFLSLYPEKMKFSKLHLAQAVICWEQSPHIVCQGQEKCFEYYYKVIKDYNPGLADESYFKKSYALVLLFRIIDQIVKEMKLPYKSSIVAYTLALLSNKTDRKVDLLNIWEEQTVSDSLNNTIKDIINDIYLVFKDPPEKTPDVRMWSRKKECWERVKLNKRQYCVENLQTKPIIMLPENAAREFIESNFHNPMVWNVLEKWVVDNNILLTDKQIQMIHGFPSVIHKDKIGIKEMSQKQYNFALSIFMEAVGLGFDFEGIKGK